AFAVAVNTHAGGYVTYVLNTVNMLIAVVVNSRRAAWWCGTTDLRPVGAAQAGVARSSRGWAERS
ncbi:hypothetical protein, partial [Actinoplanes campanulatus]|uniref:hypothetical protein n=1 Tax=Actinoplanes campanulatus TaxID=113559 RepID=UPI001952B9D7